MRRLPQPQPPAASASPAPPSAHPSPRCPAALLPAPASRRQPQSGPQSAIQQARREKGILRPRRRRRRFPCARKGGGRRGPARRYRTSPRSTAARLPAVASGQAERKGCRARVGAGCGRPGRAHTAGPGEGREGRKGRQGKAASGGGGPPHSDSLRRCPVLARARPRAARRAALPPPPPASLPLAHLPPGRAPGGVRRAAQGCQRCRRSPPCLARPLSFSAAAAWMAAPLVLFAPLHRRHRCLLLASATFGSPSPYASSGSSTEASSPSCQIVSQPHRVVQNTGPSPALRRRALPLSLHAVAQAHCGA